MAKKKQTRKKSTSTRAKQEKVARKEHLPMGVKVVSVLYYIWAILWIGFGLLVALGATIIINYLISLFPQLETVSYGTLVVVGIIVGLVLVALGILEFFVARGLWKLKPWARVTAILLSALAIINSVLALTASFDSVQIVRLIVDGGIIAYLMLSKEARRLYK
ncbi:MAG: DUF2127 domain-containing protein [Nanobdellota archaeon]